MAAPSATPRVTPTGLVLEDGHKTLITFARNPSINLWEVTVKPVGYDGGEKIKLTNMHNNTVHTFAPRRLIMLTDASMKVQYDPEALDTLLNNQLNIPDVITETYSDGSTFAYHGVMNKFERDEHQEGEVPTATVGFFATNRDSDGAEQLPVLVEVVGT